MFHTSQSSNAGHRARRRFPDFQIVLQPIVDLQRQTAYAYEALCRGAHGQNYAALIAGLDPPHIPAFDKLAIARSLRLAAKFRIEERGAKIAINLGLCLNMAERDAAYVLRLAKHYGIKPASIVLELSEGVRMDPSRLAQIVDRHRAAGVLIAIDDFGAGYASLNVLATSMPDVVKIDRELIRDIESNRAKKTIVAGFAKVCRKLGVKLIAEGVETAAEFRTLHGVGIDLMQGFLFAVPAVCELPEIRLPSLERRNFPRVTRHDREWLRNALRQ
jgi:EAL domain-containing protein (putative c-di-GMP-specific phosphodiesterase class I)